MLLLACADHRLDLVSAVACALGRQRRMLILRRYDLVHIFQDGEDHEVTATGTGAAQNRDAGFGHVEDEVLIGRALRIVTLADLTVRERISVRRRVSLGGHGCLLLMRHGPVWVKGIHTLG